MSGEPTSKHKNGPNEVPKKPHCALKLENNLQELKRIDDIESLRPYIIEYNCFSNTTNVKTAPITLDELKKLARAWKLNERRNFWKIHTTVEDFVSVLRKHVADTIRPFNIAEAERAEREAIEKVRYKQFLAQPQKFTPKFRAKSGMLIFYCGHKSTEVVRNSNDILTRSRYFQFPDLDNSLGSMIGDMRVEDFEKGRDIFDEPSIEESTASLELPDQVHRQKILTQRSLSVHLLSYSTSDSLPIDDRLAGYKAVQTFLEVGVSNDPDTINNIAMSISNLCANKFMRTLLVEQNCIHRYSAFLPHLNSPDAMMSCSLFFYYMSMEPELEDRICSAGFKMLQKSISGESMQLRLITLQCLSNLIPCAERTRCVDLIINSMHSMYRDGGDKIWTLDLFFILANISRIQMNHTAMIEADFMDLISLAVVETPKTEIECYKLITEVLSAFLISPDLAEDLMSSDYSRVFIDLLGIENDEITATCMRAFAVMSASDAFMSCVCESDIVQVVCTYVSTSHNIDVIQDIAYFLCNVCNPVTKKAKQLVQDGVAHSMLELMSLYPKNNKILYYCMIGIRDVLLEESNCPVLFSDVVPEFLKLVKASIGNIDIHLLECLINISIPVECDDLLVEYDVDVSILNIFQASITSEKEETLSSLLKIIVVLSRMRAVVERLLDHNILAALKDMVLYTVKSKQVAIWKDVARVLLSIINHQPAMTTTQQFEVVEILHHLGSSQESSEQMIADCAIVLAFLSYSMPDFSTVDPIIRSILKISESDTVMAAASTVLYNVSCNEEDSHMLLKDNLHINIMIRMMRNGSAGVQKNVAEAMRLLCIKPKCNELLLQRELLSDFIVIALLRTNNSEVKKICSEAFYNMLCHATTRTKLLKGDLWWAMMRLSKTGVGDVRMVCARTVYNLASDPNNIDALRKNYVINFIKELCSLGGNTFITIFLKVLDNVINHAAKNTRLNSLETTAVIQVLVSSLLKVSGIENCRWIGYLLSKIALIAIQGSEINEFINMELIEVLGKSMSIWTVDVECRQHFSSLLCILSSHSAFTLATPFEDIRYIMDFLVAHVVYDADENCQNCPLDSVICENIAQVIVNYVSRGLVDSKTVVEVSFFESMMVYAFTGKSYYDLEQEEVHDIVQENEYESLGHQQNNELHAELTNLKILFIQLVTFILPVLMKFKRISRIRGDKATTGQKSNKVDGSPTALIIAALPIGVLMNMNLFLDERTRLNAMRIIHGLCEDKTFAKEFTELNLISFLYELMQSEMLTQNGVVVNFCSVVCRNISVHDKVAVLLITSPNILELLNCLVALTSEKLRNDTFRRMSFQSKKPTTIDIQIGLIFADICALCYNCSAFSLPEDDDFSADGALTVLSEITAVTENKDLSHLAKVTIGRILDNSTGGSSFDPSYIAAILSEINDVNALDQDRINELVSVRPLNNCDAQLEPIFSACTIEKVSEDAASQDELWKPIVCNQRMYMEFKKVEIEGEGTKSGGRNDESPFPPVVPIPLKHYTKIYTVYPPLTTVSTIEEDRNRADGGGSLNIVDANMDSTSLHNSLVDGSSMMSGMASMEQETRDDVSTASTGRATNSGGKNPAPPLSGKKSFRETKVNRQQRKVTTVNKSDYKFRGV